MTFVLDCIVKAVMFFLTYNIISLIAFKTVPRSLSMTYYLYKWEKNMGWLFPGMMYIIAGLMMPAWIQLSAGSNFQFLSFLAPACILFVATAPSFLDSYLENRVHSISAYLAAACSILWIILVTEFWWVILIVLGIITILAFATKTVKTSYIYWLEMVAFLSTFISIILHECIK